MNAPSSRTTPFRTIAMRIVAASWAAAVALLVIQPMDLEAWLVRHFPPSHADAYAHVNGLAMPPLSTIFVTWLCASMAMIVARRYRLLAINLLAPAMAAGIVVPSVDFADPEWFTAGAVFILGCLVGLLVTAVWWVADRVRGATR
jgi:hypothetical protein